MFTGLIRLLLVLGAILFVRRVVMGLFRGSSSSTDRMRNPHPRQNPRADASPDESNVGPQQPIEEAEYEDLD